MSNKKPGTLSDDIQQNYAFHDRDSLPFTATYPLIEFSNDFIKEKASKKELHKYLISNYWYQKSNSIVREKILDRIVHINNNLSIVLKFIKDRYAHLGFEPLHISVAGSYGYADNPGDIDFDVVVNGSFFDYVTFNDGIEILDTVGSVQKVSLTVMGIDNIMGKKRIAEEIVNDGFIHQDTIVREILVAPMRNIVVYGKPFAEMAVIDNKNVLVRVARQLYFSQLTLENKIPYYCEEPLKTKKALNRIKEAQEILAWVISNL